MSSGDRAVGVGLLAEARELRSRFAKTAPTQWDAVTACAELAVQLGHLAQCLPRLPGAAMADLEDPGQPITDIGDELADVLLAVLSVCVLTDTDPSDAALGAAPAGGVADEFLHLVAICGQLSETVMVELGYRHQTGGRPHSAHGAATAAVQQCGRLARRLGLDLDAEFHTMAADAHAFLDRRGAR
ncbi:MAG: hypothetical protein ACRDT0_26640 [Pseudonocardiaceae bacterium]